ncbi:MAG: 1-acyl-sn-glycerol-3-phosphate acyltransferase [Treponema sp.]|nr:1-acyl-sn-glycerol-3-phosphate acyltransferase [Treponema sp.]
MVSFFSNIITFSTLLFVVTLPAVANILVYPVSKKACLAVSRYITKVCAPRVFAILEAFKHFSFIGFPDNKDALPPQFIIMSNHQSLMDIPLYMNFLRDKNLRFVAKDELARHVPLVSEMLRAEQHCMIPRRGSPSVAMRTIDVFGKRVVERRQIPVIFPEGTRSKDGSLGTFYAAGFRRLSDATNLPVVVCALDGGYRINNIKTFFKNLHHGDYKVKIVGIFPAPSGKEEQAALLAKGKELIQAQLDEWRR